MLENISGFIYYVSVTGITGQKRGAGRAGRHPRWRASSATPGLPVAVGFGIREPEQAAEIARIADAVVVGSALVDLVGREPGQRRPAAAELVPAVHAKVRALADGGPGSRAMSWLTDYVRPKIRALVDARDDRRWPENLWHQCPSCERMIFHRDLETNQRVCPHCAHHMRVGPDYRFASLFDEGSWQRLEMPRSPADPLSFRDQKRYTDRLKEAQARTKAIDALEAAHRAGSTACRR